MICRCIASPTSTRAVEIDRSVMAGWVGHMAALLEPLAERIARYMRAGAALHADDSVLRKHAERTTVMARKSRC